MAREPKVGTTGKIEEMAADKRQEADVYGKRPSMYDPYMKEIEELEEGSYFKIPGEIEKKGDEGSKPLSYQRCMSLKSRVEEHLVRKYAFDFIKNKEVTERYKAETGKEAYTAYVYLESDYKKLKEAKKNN